MPRPDTPLIPPGWERHHVPVADGQLTQLCQARRPTSDAVFNETTHKSEYLEPTLLFTTRCRVQRMAMRGGGGQEIGDREITLERYQVTLSRDVPEVQVNDQIWLAPDSATGVVGAVTRLRITQVTEGSLRWQRDLYCEDVVPTTR